MAMVALIQLARMKHAMFSVATDRADKALRPAPPGQRFGAAFLSTKLLDKTVQTQTFLKLDGVLFHGSAPRFSARFQYAGPGAQKLSPLNNQVPPWHLQ